MGSQFRRVQVCGHHVREHGRQQAGRHGAGVVVHSLPVETIMRHRKGTNWKDHGPLNSQSPTPSDTHPPTRLQLPILPKHLGTKYSNLRAFGDCTTITEIVLKSILLLRSWFSVLLENRKQTIMLWHHTSYRHTLKSTNMLQMTMQKKILEWL